MMLSFNLSNLGWEVGGSWPGILLLLVGCVSANLGYVWEEGGGRVNGAEGVFWCEWAGAEPLWVLQGWWACALRRGGVGRALRTLAGLRKRRRPLGSEWLPCRGHDAVDAPSVGPSAWMPAWRLRSFYSHGHRD